ncbi:VOC family protein [Microvirga pudoricolor]|uniref:VOC family protein n=1 Tax=Microvirga pudoricolor TaxID=2778729 RepID=UPI0019526F7F|nr:VOC family protein [Microvirga pudoricolor]MBM6593491.1 VOC family protein [Microvirga pudoricolor]
MSPSQGSFVWYELMTTDPAGAKAFYGHLVGWDLKDIQVPGMTYTILSGGGTDVGGLMGMPGEACDAGAQPGWMGYVGVDDVDGSAAAFERDGGTVLRAPDDIPDIGRFAVVADPQGNALCLFKSRNADGAEPVPLMKKPLGHVGWHELVTFDQAALFDFYAKQFGWTKDHAFDMGPMGVYQIFAHRGEALGGMMNKPPQAPAPFWLYYFMTDGIDEASERVTAGGGKVINGPMEVPGDAWIVQCLDPQGAMFALVGPRRQS